MLFCFLVSEFVLFLVLFVFFCVGVVFGVGVVFVFVIVLNLVLFKCCFCCSFGIVFVGCT